MSQCPTPTITATADGFGGWNVTITAINAAYIVYTTDGTIPTDPGTGSGRLASVSPFTFGFQGSPVTVKAIAFNPFLRLTDSNIASATFPVPPQVDTPTFSPTGGDYTTPQTVTIACATPGATIRFTTDNTAPSETNGYIYTVPVVISSGTTLQAIAYKSGMADSYVLSLYYYFQTAPPNLDINSSAGGTFANWVLVKLTDADYSVTIIYTLDNSTPTHTGANITHGVSYSNNGILLNTAQVNTYINAIAFDGINPDSVMVTFGPYTVTVDGNTCETPTLAPSPGTYSGLVSVGINCGTTLSTVIFTIDGTTPTRTNGTQVPNWMLPFGYLWNIPGTYTIKAMAFAPNMNDSAVVSGTYVVEDMCGSPVFSPPAGSYIGTQTVSISCSTSGASIRYTTDGSTPTDTHGTIYTGAITIASGDTTLQAIAYKSGFADSAVNSGTYIISILKCATPIITPTGYASYNNNAYVFINCITPVATIIYTTDGSAPTHLNGTVFTGTAILITASTTFNAMAYKSGYQDSDLATNYYNIVYSTAGGAPGAQVSKFSLSSGTVVSGYTTPYSISFPIPDLSGRGGLYLYTDEQDSHFTYAAGRYVSGSSTAVLQYVALPDGTPVSLNGINFPFTGNSTPPITTPLVRVQNFASSAPWDGMFATDTVGNFYVPVNDETLWVYHADGTSVGYGFAPQGTVLQIIWSPAGYLYTIERTFQWASNTYKDIICKYSTSGVSLGVWYKQEYYLSQPADWNTPWIPSMLFDVDSSGNIYGYDVTTNYVFGRSGSPYGGIFNTPLPTGAGTPCAVCVCQALGYVAVLCFTPGSGGGSGGVADGNMNGAPLFNWYGYDLSCKLFLFNMTTGALVTPSWGSILPFTPKAVPEYCGIIFDGTYLYITDKFNGYAPATTPQGTGPACQLSACTTPDGKIHCVYPFNGAVLYAQSQAHGTYGPGQVIDPAGSRPSIQSMPDGRLRICYANAAGHTVVLYSRDRTTWLSN